MNNSFPANAFFSVTFSVMFSLCAPDAQAQSITQNIAKAATQAVVTQIMPAQIQVLPQASISLIAPVGGETYTNGNRYPISWHANIPQVNTPYHLKGEIRLLDQNGAFKKDLRIATLSPDDLAKGTYTFLAGSQTDLTYNHVSAATGSYKVWIMVIGYTTSAAPITIKY